MLAALVRVPSYARRITDHLLRQPDSDAPAAEHRLGHWRLQTTLITRYWAARDCLLSSRASSDVVTDRLQRKFMTMRTSDSTDSTYRFFRKNRFLPLR